MRTTRRSIIVTTLTTALMMLSLLLGSGVANAFAPTLDPVEARGALDALPVDALPVAALPVDVCDGLAVLAVPGLELCTHGSDAMPRATATSSNPGEPVPARKATCLGDGRSGQRVEVLYLHGPGASAATSSRRTQITRWAEQVEWTVHASAKRLGGDRRVRWLTSGCNVQITSRQVSSSALGDFGRMVGELRSRGYDRSDRTYLLFTDASAYCGIATAPRDDRATSNRADRTPGYARVDRPCWGTGDRGYHSIAAHELFHTLGAVQASAPHGTKGAHCTDEHDVLCYDDGTAGGVRIVCRDGHGGTSGAGDANDRLLDCRGDDYFHPRPPSGSYLAKHWNTADSARLHDPNAPSGGSGDASGGSGTSGGSGGGGGSNRAPSAVTNPLGYTLWLVGE